MIYINILLQLIVQQYILPTRCIILISDKSRINISLPPATPIVHIVLPKLFHPLQLSGSLFKNYGCQTFILNVENPAKTFSSMEQNLKYNNETLSHRKYIIINDRYSNNNAFDVLETKEINFVSDLLIVSLENYQSISEKDILPKYVEKYVMYTHTYKGNPKNKLLLLDEWHSRNKSFNINTNLFPDKLSNQGKRGVRVGMFEYKPYVYYERKKLSKSLTMKGMEGDIMNDIVKNHNMTMHLKLIQSGYWGDILDNGTVYGLRGKLYEDQVDIAVAAFYSTERMYKYFGMSIPTLRVGITCLVPPPKLAAGWLTPVHVYTPSMWQAIFLGHLFIICSVYYIYVFQKARKFGYISSNKYMIQFERFCRIFLAINKPFIAQNLTKKENIKGHYGAFLLIVVYFMTFFLSRSYESGLATIMTIPRYEDSIETQDDFFNSNLKWSGIQVADWMPYWKVAEEEKYRNAFARYYPSNSESHLESLLKTGNFGLLIERLPGGKYHFPFVTLDQAKTMSIMKEDIHWQYCVFLLRKSSVLLPLLDKYIIRLNEAGIIHHLLNEANRSVMKQRLENAIKFYSYRFDHPKHTVVQLKLVHVAGVFGIVIVGNLLGLTVFLIELIYHYGCNCFKIRKNETQFHYLEYYHV